MSRVICVGIAVMDKIFGVAEIPTEATKVFATSYKEIGGGPAATAAVAIARLGGQSVLWARVGADPVGARIVEELAAWGVAPRVRLVTGGQSSVSGVLVDAQGERLIVAFADPELEADPAWLPLEEVGGAGAILADMRWPRASEAVMRRARRLGVPTVVDADLAPDDVAHSLVRLADYAVFSRPALERLVGMSDIGDALAAVHEICPGIVGVTAGRDGFIWRDGDEIRTAPGMVVAAVDTLGAGDVFHGAFALAIAEGATVAEAGRFANVAAALKCTRPGGRAGIPTRAEVEAHL